MAGGSATGWSAAGAWGRRIRAGAVAMAVLCAAVAAQAAPESAAVASERARVTLVSESATAVPGQTLRLGLRQKLAPHWHTYWLNPGDAGAPPEVRLSLPSGAGQGEIQWPGPDRLPFGPLVNFGYEGEIVLPVPVTVPAGLQPGDTFAVEADASWLVCERECIPEEGRFALQLPVAGATTPPGDEIAAAFAAADARMPVPSPWSARLSAQDGASLVLALEGPGLAPDAVAQAAFFPAAWGVIDHAAEQALSVEPGQFTLTLARGVALDASAPVEGLVAVTDVQGQTRWLSIEAPALGAAGAVAVTSAGAAPALLPWWQAAVFAFLGGLILNLMPCVFPVLAMKATSVASLAGGALREVRLSGLFYTLGVLAAFVALALALLAARAGGAAVGWGFQFQSPWFVTVMAWLLLAIGLNLSGVFEVGTGLAGTGQGLAAQSGHRGSFFTGLLAVVVATPCTAPFMGAALGTALAAPPTAALALFVAMGLGLALPYALLGVFPCMALLLPRPGAWMLRLKQGMAFLMYASAAWLVWVLAQQAGDSGVLVGLVGAVLVGLAAWLYGLAQQGRRRTWLPRGASLATVAGALALLPLLGALSGPAGSPAVAAGTGGGQTSEPYSPERLAALRTEGRPVFVNMTAAWCITCLVNERTTLSTDAVQRGMREAGVVYMKGDWTRRDPDITRFLQEFGRDGLPFYVFYPGPHAEPRVLPPVLTEGLLRTEFDRTAG